jgi:hypothetical protein
MATFSTGTVGATTLTNALAVTPSMSDADIATIAQSILDDQNVAHPIYPGAFVREGLLYVPNRGVLKLLVGDVVAVDPGTGWPILISKNAYADGNWH